MNTQPALLLSFALTFILTTVVPFRSLNAQHERNGLKAVVVISIDQMRADYITRFQKFYSDSGIKYMMKNGTTFTNARFQHATMTTAPGHATLLTGCYSGKSGIISNEWYDRMKHRVTYSIEDTSVGFVESGGLNKSGQRSAANLLVSTIGDELKTVSPDSKVIAVSIKDRASVLLAGKKADAAYWFDDRLGSFVSSTAFMNAYPLWVKEYNREKRADQYFGATWDRALDAKAYSICEPDDSPFESNYYSLGTTFPKKLTGGVAAPDRAYYKALRATPFCGDLLFDFAQQAIVGEQLGNRGVTDMLAISISSIDFIGHDCGPDSHEIMDACIRLDRQLASFFRFLESTIGLKRCLLVLTADHGAATIPELMKQRGKDAGRVYAGRFIKELDENLRARFGSPSTKSWIEATTLPWLFIQRDAISEKNLTLRDFDAAIKEIVLGFPGIAHIVSRHDIEFGTANAPVLLAIRRSYYTPRSGDYFIGLKENYLWSDEGETTGTSHGSFYDYDTRVPLILSSSVTSRGTAAAPVGIADLAPTIARCLDLQLPGERDGKALPLRISKWKEEKKKK